MLTINTRNDQLTAARNNFLSRGMLDGTCLSEALENLEDASDTDDDSGSYIDDGYDLDADEDEDETGPVADEHQDEVGSATRLPMLSEVTLAQKRGE